MECAAKHTYMEEMQVSNPARAHVEVVSYLKEGTSNEQNPLFFGIS